MDNKTGLIRKTIVVVGGVMLLLALRAYFAPISLTPISQAKNVEGIITNPDEMRMREENYKRLRDESMVTSRGKSK